MRLHLQEAHNFTPQHRGGLRDASNKQHERCVVVAATKRRRSPLKENASPDRHAPSRRSRATFSPGPRSSRSSSPSAAAREQAAQADRSRRPVPEQTGKEIPATMLMPPMPMLPVGHTLAHCPPRPEDLGDSSMRSRCMRGMRLSTHLPGPSHQPTWWRVSRRGKSPARRTTRQLSRRERVRHSRTLSTI